MRSIKFQEYNYFSCKILIQENEEQDPEEE